jgi:hypothetical protein
VPPLFRVVADSTWAGRYDPPREKAFVLSVYLPRTGDAIVELSLAIAAAGEEGAPTSVTVRRAPLDRGLARVLQIWAAQHVVASTPVKEGWVVVRMDASTTHSVVAGGSACIRGEGDVGGADFRTTLPGKITTALRDLAEEKTSRHATEDALRRLLVAD